MPAFAVTTSPSYTTQRDTIIARTDRDGVIMPRPCYRVRLESGIKLDINRLARGGFIRPGAANGPVGIGWTDYYGEVIASGLITADMSRTDVGHFRIQLGELDQQIFLVARPRHF